MAYLSQYRKLSLTAWLLLVAVLINAISVMIILFLSLYLVNSLQFNMKQSGEIVTFFGIGSVIGAYLGGRLSDFISPLKLGRISLIVNALGLYCLVFIKSYTLLLWLLAFVGLSNAIFSPVSRIILMANCRPDQRYLVNNLRYVMLNIGSSAIFIGGMLISYSYNFFFIFNATMVLFAALLLFMVKDTNFQEEEIIEKPLKNKKMSSLAFFILVNLLVFFVTIVYSQQRVTYTIYLNHYYGMDSTWISYLYLFSTLLIVFFQIPLTNMLRQTNLLIISGVGGSLICLGLFCMNFSTQTPFAFLVCFVWTIGEMMFYPMVQVLIFEIAPANRKGKFLGIYQAVFAAGNIVGPYAGSRVYHFYSPHLVWKGCGLMLVLVVIVTMTAKYLSATTVLAE